MIGTTDEAERKRRKLESGKRYREKHQDAIRAKSAAYRAKNHKRLREAWAEYYERNRDAVNKKNLSNYYKNRERDLARGVRYRKANAEKCKARIRDWERRNPDYSVNRNAERRAKIYGTTATDRASIRAWHKAWKQKRAVRCYWCDSSTSPKQCELDHIIPLSNGGKHSIENVCIACRECNARKSAKALPEWNAKITSPVLL